MIMTFEQVLQVIVTGGLILGSTWKLSAQISAISTKLDEHIRQDTEKFAEVDRTLDAVAPRVIRLPNRRG
jgi:hypothetical protein